MNDKPFPFTNRLALATLLALSAAAAGAAEHLVPLDWDAQGRFERSLNVAPGKFVEVCGKLARGAKVEWRFDSDAALDFNIHYHEGKETRFPARAAQLGTGQGTLDAPLDQDYCWMWTNKGRAATALKLRLAKG